MGGCFRKKEIGGLLIEMQERQGVWANQPLSSSSHRQEQRRGMGGRRRPGRRRPGAWRRSWRGAKGGGGRGEPVPCLTSGRGDIRGPGDGSGRRPALAAVAAALQLRIIISKL